MPFSPQDSSQRSTETSNMRNKNINGDTKTEEMDPSVIKAYVQSHPKLLDEIILSLRSTKELQQLLQQKQSNILDSTNTQFVLESHEDICSKYSFSSIKQQTETLLKESRERDLSNVLFNATEILASALQVEWYSLYLPYHNDQDLYEYESDGNKKRYGPIGTGMTVSAEAAFVCKTLLVENLPQNGRYPKGVGHPERDVHSVLSVPLVFPSGDLLGVIELCRGGLEESFGERDLQIANSLLGWMVSSLHESKINSVFIIQSKLNDFLMDTTKELFDDMISIDRLVEHILIFSKDLVHADRCAMFLVNEEKKQLYADYFDEGIKEDGKYVISKKHQIRFSVDEGIAGHVYKTGEVVNIADAYRDERFNPEIDKQTGYHTKNILCMPIVSKYRVVGVVQMVNSLANDHFTHADEDAFKTFAVYCALALHYSMLYNLLQQSESQYKVAMDVLQYHIVAPEEESRHLQKVTPPELIPDAFHTYDFDPYVCERELPQLFIYMINDLFGENTFDFNKLSKFIVTVRKNYRPLAYHNWVHGFTVAHALYVIIKTNPNVFDTHEEIAIMIAGVCHDLDHRGYNNIFYQEFNLPLADLYGTSVMEHHHYKHTITVLQLEGHDIFSFLSSYDYKKMLDLLRDAIIATDLSVNYKTQKHLAEIIENNKFDLQDAYCRSLTISLIMSAADLCAVAKPWHTQEEMVSRIYDEFYAQGDVEKKCGLQPSEMMDRDFKDVTAKQQVGFIQFICLPRFTVLANILPGTKPLLTTIKVNLEKWQQLDEERERESKNKYLYNLYNK